MLQNLKLGVSEEKKDSEKPEIRVRSVKSKKNLRRRKFRVQERESLKSLNIRLFHRELSLKRKCKAAATVFNRFTNENGISQLAIER